jgi:SAM-dependent methyltransferase
MSGRILDVACGKGATTRYLLRRFSPSDVTGVDLSAQNVAIACENAPGVTFRPMSATELEFADNSFDGVLCVEAAFLFETRQRFLREAFRVLKPGGVLVMTDILCQIKSGPLKPNNVDGIDEYQRRFLSTGFADAQVEDATYNCWIEFVRHRNAYLDRIKRKGKISPRAARRLQVRTFMANLFLRHYVLLTAEKSVLSPRGKDAT